MYTFFLPYPTLTSLNPNYILVDKTTFYHSTRITFHLTEPEHQENAKLFTNDPLEQDYELISRILRNTSCLLLSVKYSLD